MDEHADTRARIAIWMSMAEHFLGIDTDGNLPATARLCVESGRAIEGCMQDLLERRAQP
jgi:hypothetical protein